ncbi:hypothetical protein B296_00031350 [Ensete ventricosum]|uniref:COPA/B TPR domain-containing protein n=1 Tax=Ensete ventricosum TaxID=4639 RepID=A0A427AGE4_ENSVE|nr:hypothetical protein B296_00031350 [Ensete ventricosum]
MLVYRYGPVILQNLYWADSGDLLVIASDTSFYILKYKVTTMFHLDRPMYLLGYLASQSRVYLIDKEFNVAHFLESRGMLEDALEVATDPNYRFDLAVQLGRLEIAKSIWTIIIVENRGKYPPAEEYLSYAEKSQINLVEVFKSMQIDEERPPLENGDSGHEVCYALYTKSFMLSHYFCGISVRASVHGSTNKG